MGRVRRKEQASITNRLQGKGRFGLRFPAVKPGLGSGGLGKEMLWTSCLLAFGVSKGPAGGKPL